MNQQVSLKSLSLSSINVRKTQTDITGLAQNIAVNGLLQNLSVIKKGKGFEVVAGGRRLQALQLLAKEGKIAQDFAVNIQVVEKEDAVSVSLSENSARSNMSPVDEFKAFETLSKEGKSIEEIGAQFGVTPTVVSRRLKLAQVAPSLLALFDEDEIDLAQLMALASTDDQELQVAVWESAGWRKDADDLRSEIMERSQRIDSNHRLVRFIGVETYRNAGGALELDLFNDEDAGGFLLSDGDLVFSLAKAKLDEITADLEADESLAWVDANLTSEFLGYSEYRRVSGQVGKMAKADEAIYKANKREIAKLDATSNEIEWEDEDAQDQEDAINTQLEPLQAQNEALEEQYTQYSEEQRPFIGAWVGINRKGELSIERGVMRNADVKKAGSFNTSSEDAVSTPKPDHSSSLVSALTAHRSMGLQAVVAQSPHKALVILTAKMLSSLGSTYTRDLDAIKLSANNASQSLVNLDATIQDGKAYTLMANLGGRYNDLAHSENILEELALWTQEELLELLAFCTAKTLNTVTAIEANPSDSFLQLGKYVELDSADWFTPTASNYFGKISKATLIRLLGEKGVNDVGALKRGELAVLAETTYAGSRWLPELLKI